MSKFKKNKDKGLPAVSSAALPDIIFILLSFFIVVSKTKERDVELTIRPPKAEAYVALEKEDFLQFVYVGKKRGQKEVTYQLNDTKVNVTSLDLKIRQTSPQDPGLLSKQKIYFKIDKNVDMYLIDRVEEECREADALKIVYATQAK